MTHSSYPTNGTPQFIDGQIATPIDPAAEWMTCTEARLAEIEAGLDALEGGDLDDTDWREHYLDGYRTAIALHDQLDDALAGKGRAE